MDLRRKRTLNILKLSSNKICSLSDSSLSIFDDSDADKDYIQPNTNNARCSITSLTEYNNSNKMQYSKNTKRMCNELEIQFNDCTNVDNWLNDTRNTFLENETIEEKNYSENSINHTGYFDGVEINKMNDLNNIILKNKKTEEKISPSEDTGYIKSAKRRLEMDLIDVDENNAMKITMLDTNHLDFEVLSSVKFDDVKENKKLVQYSDSSSIESESEKSPVKGKKRTRKRQSYPMTWLKNKRKEAVERGLGHTNYGGKVINSKTIKKNLLCTNCSFKCRENFDDSDIQQLHTLYYDLNRKDKMSFLLNFTERVNSKQLKDRRKYSFRYYFYKNEAKKIRVCKQFFLKTLCISPSPIYHVHSEKNPISLTPPNEKRGLQAKCHVHNVDKDNARLHIASFPTICSHYCRSDTKKKYLNSDLNISKMYELYKSQCILECKEPISKHMYRDLFNNEFNLDFHCPKKDLCDTCEEFKVLEKNGNLNENKVEKFENHVIMKDMMRLERQEDKKNCNDKNVVVCFDLENVLTLPQCNVGIAFYKRKLNVYNMTAHLSFTKDVYCAIWNESIVGRSGNDLASAVVYILDKILCKYPYIENITTWSDSCVPQNRNSLISTAILGLLMRHPNLKIITMKYSVSGHSCIQEVDNAHSQIENKIKKLEIWSPISLIRALISVNNKKPFLIFQLCSNDFKNFYDIAKQYKFNLIPFGSVYQLQFSQNSLSCIKYKTSYGISDYVEVCIETEKTPCITQFLNPKIACLQSSNSISKEKINDIKSLYKFMPDNEIQYYKTIFKE